MAPLVVRMDLSSSCLASHSIIADCSRLEWTMTTMACEPSPQPGYRT
eukprot:CAMPEP_0205909068 /NCGR_PEP_ID=MMETSP1325-20131115/3626_1 /ASSEMBLY_ACC=CAM_ASM_000708 /TAXON_ID=236786 /ORGANISM="Florenciella sp., Strain RCC1007" /LENGTH=46 /DNA_ID= /DNA_START= /DNA_END= /DNA_ORIENTATION=